MLVRSKNYFLPGLFFLACLFFFACGNDQKIATPPVATNAQPAAQPAVEPLPPEVASDKTIRIRMEADVPSVNTLLTKSAYARWVANRIFQSLGIADPQTQETKPWIVKKIPQKRIEKTGPYAGKIAYDLEILPEAVWDNGSPLTANDVIFSIKLVMHPLLTGESFRSGFDHLLDLQPDAANPKKFTAWYGQYDWLSLDALCGTPIYPAYFYDPTGACAAIPLTNFLDDTQNKALADNASMKTFAESMKNPKFFMEKDGISGSGAYQLELLRPGAGVILTRKKDWWGDKALAQNPMLASYPERLVYRLVKDESAVETMLRNGELDLATGISSGKFVTMQADAALSAQYDFNHYTSNSFNYWFFNLRNPKLADKRVRQALAHLVDYDGVITNVLKGMGKRSVGPVSPFRSYYNDKITPYDFNVNKATELLKAAGWADTDGNGTVDKVIGGQKTELKISLYATNVTELAKSTAESIKEMARRAGVEIDIQWMEIAKITQETVKGNFESAQTGLSIPVDDFRQILHSKSVPPNGDNRTGFVNQKADQLLEAIAKEENPSKRAVHFKALQALLYEELPFLMLHSPENRTIVAKKFAPVFSPVRPGYYEEKFKKK